jgi:CheY-like chemotaxis protein
VKDLLRGLPARRVDGRILARECTSIKNAGIRVLLFDGDPIHRETLTDELSKQGFVVQSFGDGGALLGALRTAVDIDVIVVLLKISGIDLLVKLHRQGVNVPVVLLTRRALPSHECLAFDKGASSARHEARTFWSGASRMRSRLPSVRTSRRATDP